MDATAVFGPDLLCAPAAEAVARYRLLPLEWFRDDRIHTMDFRTWAGAERHYLQEQREHFDKLLHQIEAYGLLERIDISWHAPGYLPHIGNGHHRVIALRRLGWTHIPYRWYNPTRSSFGDYLIESDPLPWTPPTSE